ERTVWTTEWKEEMREVTTWKPVTEKVERAWYVCVPTETKETRERTVWTTEWKEEMREVTTWKPVTEKVERAWYVCVPTVEKRKVTQTYYTPVVSQEKRTAVYTVCNTVPETQMRTVTCYKPVMTPGGFDACGHWVGGGCQTVPVTTQVPVTVYRNVP